MIQLKSQGWGPDEELQAELYQPGTPLIGAVAYFPENYGSKIVPLVLQCLNGQPAPPASYAERKLIAREAPPAPVQLVPLPPASRVSSVNL